MKKVTNNTAIAVAERDTDPEKYLEALLSQPTGSLQLLEETRPFALPELVERAWDGTQESTRETVEKFLAFQFCQLTPFGVTFSPLSPKECERERASVKKTVKKEYDRSLKDQQQMVLEEYHRFFNIRETLYTLNAAGNLSPAFLVPTSCISDLIVTAPVAFPLSKKGGFTDFVCNLNPTPQFANFFQMFNPTSSPQTTMGGSEFIPRSLARVLPSAQKGFDQLAVFTPYHNEVWKRWPLPQKGIAANTVAPPVTTIDPFLFGFLSGSPFMIFLGRWARTSITPCADEMIAETMEFLQKWGNELISRIATSATPSWYDPLNPHPETNHWRWTRQRLEHDLRVTIENITGTFKAGKLLPYLRGAIPVSAT